jgi:uncharacterized protein
MESMLLMFLLVTSGAFITSLTGLGGGTLVLAGLLLVYSPTLAIPLHSFNQLTANGFRTLLFRKVVDWKTVLYYGLLMLPAAWIGAHLFDLVNPNWLKIFIGVAILASLRPARQGPQQGPAAGTFVLLGAVSGFLGVFVGAVGPMVTPFFNRLKLSREAMLSTKSAGQMVLQMTKIAAFSGTGTINFLELKHQVLLLVLGSLVGVALSIPVSRRISDRRFNVAVNILLGLIALKVLFEGMRGLLVGSA